ncbi:spore cortex biosynthesis protein YabQ [Candidatus Allofournierella excrementavium]|uniref:spore cortex biosynthesis protein YabQ n=1 Tax=Candidatus Allofournierella excrementavium TaxID=2838591 RepID=UPI003AF4DEC8
MVALAAPPYVLADTLCCLGLGFFLAACYDLARFFLGGSRPVCFVLDLAAALAAAVLACSFAASRSYSGVVRWYMAAGLALGLAGYFFVLAPGCAAAQRLVKWTIARPFVLLWLLAMRPLARLCGRAARAAGNKLSVAAKKRRKKQLKNKARVLYNSDNPLVTPRE